MFIWTSDTLESIASFYFYIASINNLVLSLALNGRKSATGSTVARSTSPLREGLFSDCAIYIMGRFMPQSAKLFFLIYSFMCVTQKRSDCGIFRLHYTQHRRLRAGPMSIIFWGALTRMIFFAPNLRTMTLFKHRTSFSFI